MKLKLDLSHKGILYAFKNDYTYRMVGFDKVNGKMLFKVNWNTLLAVKKENRI